MVVSLPSWVNDECGRLASLDEKDIAIVKANLGKSAIMVGPIGTMTSAPKVYVATQRRPR